MDRNREAAAVAVFDPRGRVLLLRRGPTAPWMPGWWNLPGGVVDWLDQSGGLAHEAGHKAAERELHEEAGLVANVCSVPREFFYEKGTRLWLFHTQVAEGWEPILDFESDGWQWGDPAALPEKLVYPLHEAIPAAAVWAAQEYGFSG